MELNKNKGLREEQYSSWSRDILTLQDSRKLWLYEERLVFLKVCQILVKWRGTNQIFTLRKKGFENWLPTHFYAQLAAKKPINHVVWSIHNFQVFYCNLTSWFVIIKLWHRFSFGFASSWFSTIHFHGIVSGNSNVMFLLFHRTIIADFWKTQIVVRYSVEIPTWTVGTIEIGNQ